MPSIISSLLDTDCMILYEKRGLEEKKRNQKVEKKSWSWWRETCDGSSAPWLNMWLCLTVSCRQILIQCQPYITKWKEKKKKYCKKQTKTPATLMRCRFIATLLFLQLSQVCDCVKWQHCLYFIPEDIVHKAGSAMTTIPKSTVLKKRRKSPSSFKIDRKKHLHELAELDIRLSKRLLWMLRLTPALLTRLGLVFKKLETPNWRPGWDLCSSKWRPTPWHHLVS